MAKAKTATPDATTMRRCVGSKTFSIEPHDAPLADFPVQPSRKDGLGVMCKPHWTEYTRSLRQAQRARQAGGEAPAAVVTPIEDKTGATGSTRARRAKASAEPAAVTEARAVLARVDHLSGSDYLAAVASDEVQDALRIMATTSAGPEIHDAMRDRQRKYQAEVAGEMTVGEYEDAVAVDEAVAAAEA